MGIRTLDEWAGGYVQTFSLGSLKDAVIGVDADYYLAQLLNRPDTKEPLLTALGGHPFSIRAWIEKDLAGLKTYGITCIFVFDGLDFGKQDNTSSSQTKSALAHENAWGLYDQQHAEQVVEAFSNAGTVKPDTLHTFLQRILHERSINFMVAPYSAAAQLSYLEKHPSQYIDAVVGSTEYFLFDMDKVITRLNPEHSQFSWLSRRTLQEELGRISNESFLDACLLLGSRYLPTFPPLENTTYPSKGFGIKDALTMMTTTGRTVVSLCSHYHDDPQVQQLQYLDRYKRALMTLKHHVILGVDGKVGPLDIGHASSDMHELIGQRLPEELYFYMSKGVLGSQIPKWLTSGEIRLNLPLGVSDSEAYRRLVTEQLTPLRTQSLCLLSNSLHRFYQTKVITLRPWYDDKSDRVISLRDLPSVKDSIAAWSIHDTESADKSLHPLSLALSRLNDPGFVSKSTSKSTSPKDGSSVLHSKEEIVLNSYWRLLQLRGFVGSDHQLTTWGKCLTQAISSLDPADRLEEPVFVAVELLRLGVLNSKDMFPGLSGGPMRGSDDDKKRTMLVSRVACLGKIGHRPLGYSGPLSRQFLGYQAMISAVRSNLRNLVEVILAALLLNGDADRDRNDWVELSLGLPFIDDNDCGLGIAVRTYLDDLLNQPEPTSDVAKGVVKDKGKEWFQHGFSFDVNLERGFKLWDAVYIGAQHAGKEFKDVQSWEMTDKWLADLR